MSAFVVSDRHIDALITAGLTMQPKTYGPLRWQEPGPRDATDYERGEPWGPTAIATSTAAQRELTEDNASHVGRMLLLENLRSVAHRYDEPFDLPDYEFTPWGDTDTVLASGGPYVVPRRPDPVVILSLIDGYEYQSCEHPGWENSDARAFCDALRMACIHALPGYDAAPWTL